MRILTDSRGDNLTLTSFKKPRRMWMVFAPDGLGLDMYESRRQARIYAHPGIDRVVPVIVKLAPRKKRG